MKNLVLYFKYKKTAVLIAELFNIAAGITFIVSGILASIINNKYIYISICLGTIVCVFIAILLYKYSKVVKECAKEVELLSIKIKVESEQQYQEEQKELLKIQKRNEEQLAKLRNPFNVGDNVKNKLNIYSKEIGETIPSGTIGKVVESINDGTIKVKFTINGKKVIVLEKIDIFKKIY